MRFNNLGDKSFETDFRPRETDCWLSIPATLWIKQPETEIKFHRDHVMRTSF